MGTEPQTAWMKIFIGFVDHEKNIQKCQLNHSSILTADCHHTAPSLSMWWRFSVQMGFECLDLFYFSLHKSYLWTGAGETANLHQSQHRCVLTSYVTERLGERLIAVGVEGGVSSLKPKCLFSASVLNSLAEMSRHSHLSPAPGKLLPASRSVLVFLSWFNLLWWSCYPCQGSGWEYDAWKSWLNVNSVGKKLSLWQRPVSGLFLPLVVGGLLLKAFNMTFFPWNVSWAVSNT